MRDRGDEDTDPHKNMAAMYYNIDVNCIDTGRAGLWKKVGAGALGLVDRHSAISRYLGISEDFTIDHSR